MESVIASRETSTGDVTTDQVHLRGLVFHQNSTAGAGRITLANGSGGNTQFDMSSPTGAKVREVMLPGRGIPFPAGINIATLTNMAAVTIIYSKD